MELARAIGLRATCRHGGSAPSVTSVLTSAAMTVRRLRRASSAGATRGCDAVCLPTNASNIEACDGCDRTQLRAEVMSLMYLGGSARMIKASLMGVSLHGTGPYIAPGQFGANA